MKQTIYQLTIFAIVLMGCSNSNAEKDKTKKSPEPTATEVATNKPLNSDQQDDGIVGAWQLALEASDDNDNYILNDDERKNGFANKFYYKFNADGSCVINSMQLKGHYEIKTEGGKRKLYTYLNEGYRKESRNNDLRENEYEIVSVSKAELVLMFSMAGLAQTFWVFKRVK
jgi:uncharacterized lipoprotein NlpE involved in copper resistance